MYYIKAARLTGHTFIFGWATTLTASAIYAHVKVVGDCASSRNIPAQENLAAARFILGDVFNGDSTQGYI